MDPAVEHSAMKRALCFGILILVLCMGQMCGLVPPANDRDDTANSDPPAQSSGPPNTPTAIHGPSFSISIPAGYEQTTPPPVQIPLTFLDAYTDGRRLILVSVQHLTGATISNPGEFRIRIQGSLITDSGDFVLLAVVESDDPAVLDALAGYALLANGDVLCAEIDAAQIGGFEQLLGLQLFRSIDIQDTDGRPIEEIIRGKTPKLMDKSVDGMIVLDDLTVWGLHDRPTPEEGREFASWQVGDPIHNQSTAHPSTGYELVHVGNWKPIRALYFGVATRAQLVNINSEEKTLALSNGKVYTTAPHTPPSTWNTGDEVLVFKDSVWTNVINRTTGQVFRF